jgi:hypothetical protein
VTKFDQDLGLLVERSRKYIPALVFLGSLRLSC